MVNGQDVGKLLHRAGEAVAAEQIEQDMADNMRGVAMAIDRTFNPEGTLIRDRRGYLLMVFPASSGGKANYVASIPEDKIIEIMRRQVARHDERQAKIAGAAEAVSGHA